MKTPKLLFLGPGIALLLALLIFRTLSERKAPESPPPSLPAAGVVPLSEDKRLLNAPHLALKRQDVAIGPIAAGAAPERIRALLGTPGEIVIEAPYRDEITEKDLPLESWRYDGLTIYILDNRVVQITATSPKWPSGRGLRPGDGLERALELHGAPETVLENDLIYCWKPASSFCPLTITMSPGRAVVSIAYDAWPD